MNKIVVLIGILIISVLLVSGCIGDIDTTKELKTKDFKLVDIVVIGQDMILYSNYSNDSIKIFLRSNTATEIYEQCRLFKGENVTLKYYLVNASYNGEFVESYNIFESIEMKQW